jgi:hypothetical protein
MAASCTLQPDEPTAHASPDRYVISIPAIHGDSIRFRYTAGSGRRFILPYHFFDNPAESVSGPLVRDLMVVDADDRIIDTTSEIAAIGPQASTVISIPDNAVYPVTISYRLNLSNLRHDPAAKMMPEVHISDSTLFLIGAYCLILPQTDAILTGQWRSRRDIAFAIDAPEGLPLYGIPGTTFTCANNYECMFLQLCGGKRPVARGMGGTTEFVFIDYLNVPRPAGRIDSLASIFSVILGDVTSVFGTLPGAPYTVSFQNIWGGLEGLHGFSIGEAAENPGSRFGEILAHEALHSFVGIRCGEFDDPWWKESAAAWLGLETAVRLGYYEKDLFRDRMTRRFGLADSLPQFRRALSDPALRSDLFPNALYGLVYDRGAQIMMLLDVRIRIGSSGHSTLAGVTADLCRRYDNSAFNREDFVSALEKGGASDARTIFTAYVDTPDSVPSEELLKRTYATFDSLVPY